MRRDQQKRWRPFTLTAFLLLGITIVQLVVSLSHAIQTDRIL